MQSSGPASWAPQKRQKVQAYLSSLQSANQTGEVDPLDIFTRPQADLNTLFTQVEAARNVTPGANQTPDKPSLQVRTRPLSQPQELFRATASAKTASGTPPAPAQHHRPAHTVSSVRQAKSTTGTMNTANLNSSAASVRRSAQALPTAQVKLAETQPIAHDSTPNLAGTAAPEQAYAEVESTSPTTTNNQATQPAVFDRSLPFPSLPSEPNLLLGMVHDNQKKIIPNAIIEILDDKGTTVRAMKTNALRSVLHFFRPQTGSVSAKSKPKRTDTLPGIPNHVNDTV